MNKHLNWKKFLLLIIILLPACIYSQPKPARIFSNNMVLQRNAEIPIWGKASPNEQIQIRFDSIIVNGKSNNKGDWMLRLPIQSVCNEPRKLIIKGVLDSIVLKNILIGDVWFASGQSNMEHPVQGWEWIPHSAINNYEEELQDAEYPQIRLFNVPKFPSPVPLDDLKGGNWEQADSASVAPFSSTAWFFAKQLHKELDVPIGIINSSWGGTPIKSWMSRESAVIFEDSIYIPELPENFNQKAWIETVKKAIENHRIRRNQISYPTKNIENELITIDYDDSAWHKTDLADVSIHFGNIVWLRKKIILPEIEAEKKLIISLGFMNRQSHIYFNGHKIGYFQYPEPVKFTVPQELLNTGENILCVRLAHPGKQTSIYGTNAQFSISTPDKRFRLKIAQSWLFNDSLKKIVSNPQSYQNKTSFLFNGMVAPVIPYVIKGVVWYQGESNAGQPELYEEMFQQLILDWRKHWDADELLFLFFQLSKTKFSHLQNEPDKWKKVRKAQKKALKLPNTGMVKTIDLGDPYDIHPHNKQDFGFRMAKLALKKGY